jgi:CheY-like chemotaxis protein
MSGEQLTILLVEDNEDHAELVKRSFENHRLANNIYHVKDGVEALNYLFREDKFTDPKSSPRANLILLDLRLPKIDGLEVLKEIRASNKYSGIPVVILTTSKADTDLVKAYDYHVNSYLVKPVDFEKFSQLMDDLGFYWLAWNQKP